MQVFGLASGHPPASALSVQLHLEYHATESLYWAEQASRFRIFQEPRIDVRGKWCY